MANSSTHIIVDGVQALNLESRTDREAVELASNYLHAICTGVKSGTVKIQAGGTAPVKAHGTLTLASSSGAVGGVINGVTVTDTWATSDIVSAGLIATAINASTNALVQYLVTASNIAGVVALASVAADTEISVDGYVFKAKAAGTAGPGEFIISGSNTADGDSLVTAMKAITQLNDKYIIVNASGTVTIAQRAGGSVNSMAKILATAATVTVTQPAATLVCYVSAISPGILGNCITFAASGTNVTASAARLTAGAGGNITPVNCYR